MQKSSSATFLQSLLLFLCVSTALSAAGQSERVKKKWALKDSLRTTADSLYGVYITKDLEDCFQTINAFWDDSTRNAVRAMEEQEFSARTHRGFGMWMRNNWQLWGGSRLSVYFNKLEIYHPDDMSAIILTSYHRFLNGKEVGLESQISLYRDYWKSVDTRKDESKKLEFAAYQTGDTVLFDYPLDFVSRKQENAYYDDVCIATGKIIERNEEKFLIKVLLLESCSRRGIICYDNKNHTFYDPKTRTWKKQLLRKRKRQKSGEARWYTYNDWDTKD